MTDSDTPEPPQRKPLTAEEKQALVVRRKADAEAAMQQYRADAQATRDRTAKLRAERLEREKDVNATPKQTSQRRSKPR